MTRGARPIAKRIPVSLPLKLALGGLVVGTNSIWRPRDALVGTRPCGPGKINAPPRLTSQNISPLPFDRASLQLFSQGLRLCLSGCFSKPQAVVKGVPRPTFPKTLPEFQSQFSTEEACQKYLASCRWPDGFVCPRCGNQSAYELVKP